MNNENNQNQVPNQGAINPTPANAPVTPKVTETAVNNNEQKSPTSVPSTPQQTVTSTPEVSVSPVQPVQPIQPVQPVQAVQAVQAVQTPVAPNQSQPIETSNTSPATPTFSQPTPNPVNQNIQPQPPVESAAPIINTEAAKAKANEIATKAKAGLGSYKEKLKSDKKVLIISILAIIIVLFALMNYIQTGGSKSVVKTYANAMVKYNSKKLAKVYHQNYIDFMEDLTDEEMEDILDETFERYEKRDYRILKYKIIDYEKYDKDQLENFAEDLEDDYDIDEKDVKKVIEYAIKFTIDDDGDKEIERTEVHAVKIKNKWYIFE